MRSHRILIAFGVVTFLCPTAALAVDGVIEINATSIIAAGGYPYTIPAPGSYALTGNLAPPAGAAAIVIGAANVELDLNGFTITSPGGGGPNGIDAAGNIGLTVRRGAVTGFGGTGILLGPDSKVIEMRVATNGTGIGGGGGTCLIVMSVITGNTGAGVQVARCKIENNMIEGNGGVGIVGDGSVIVHNRIATNFGGGIMTPSGNKIQENVIQFNSSFGIVDAPPPAPPPPVPPTFGIPRNNIIGNTIDSNFGGPGISLSNPALIRDNTVSSNGTDGIRCGAACVVNGNVVESNNPMGGPPFGGVTVAEGSNVHGNTIDYNGGYGLTMPGATTSYTNNTIVSNGVPPGVGPNVISVPTVTGGFGNVCVFPPAPPGACP